jgi:nucleoside-diphosphate-sugar epimerase
MQRDLVLITGGAGYVGSHLVSKLLHRGHRVRVLDAMLYGDQALVPFRGNPNFEVIVGDVRRSRDLARSVKDARAVVALAALVGDPACAIDPRATWAINVDATGKLLAHCRDVGVERLVFASSCSVYGANGTELLEEHSHLNPVSLYAQTRIASEQLLFRDRGPVDVVVLRLATVCGLSQRMRFDLMVNTLTANASIHRRIRIVGARQWRPHIHVQDAADAFVRAVEAPRERAANDIFNVGSDDQNFTVGDVAKMVMEHIPGTIQERDDEIQDPRSYRVSFAHVREKLGFVPRRTVDDAISEVHAVLRGVADYGDKLYHNVKQLQGVDRRRMSA